MSEQKNTFPDIEPSEEQIKEYLNTLRDSGVTNMFGAGLYIQRRFNLSEADACDALTWWMDQF